MLCPHYPCLRAVLTSTWPVNIGEILVFHVDGPCARETLLIPVNMHGSSKRPVCSPGNVDCGQAPVNKARMTPVFTGRVDGPRVLAFRRRGPWTPCTDP